MNHVLRTALLFVVGLLLAGCGNESAKSTNLTVDAGGKPSVAGAGNGGMDATAAGGTGGGMGAGGAVTGGTGAGGAVTGGTGAGGSGGATASDCFESPTTHFEIINACTEAVKVKKTPKLKGLNADGSLPPLP